MSDTLSMSINSMGILVWILLWFCGGLHEIVTQNDNTKYLAFLFPIMIVVFVLNMCLSDDSESTYEEESRLKRVTESNAATLCGMILTVTIYSGLIHRNTISAKHKRSFFRLMVISFIICSSILYEISIPKDAKMQRIARKVEYVMTNIALSTAIMGVLYVISYR